MWIDRLDLSAFGHFTDSQLTLGPGFHLIYGPNEAGKSTTLRAIRQLLFGFDERTTDNFVHQNPSLCIGGILKDESGRMIEVVRRKTRKDSLLAADQQTAIDPTLWEEWVCQTDEATFTNRYGIDYDQLRKGGDEIASGTGDLGQILFAASAGILDLSSVQKSLADEAAEIFKPQGKKQRLNMAIGEWQTQRENVIKSHLPVAEWEEVDQLRQSSQERLKTVLHDVQKFESQRDLLLRKEKSRPFLIELRKLEQALAKFESIPSLAANFAARKQEAVLLWNQNTTIEANESERLKKLEDEIGLIVVPKPVIESAREIAELMTDWGSYRKAQSDRPQLVEQLTRLREQAESFLTPFERESERVLVTQLRIDRGTRQTLTNLAQRESQLSAAIQQSEKLAANLAEQISELTRQSGALPPTENLDALKSIVKTVRDDGDLESRWQQLSAETDAAKARLSDDCSYFGISIDDIKNWKSIQLPSEDQIQIQDVAMENVRTEKSVLKSRLAELETEFATLRQQIDELRNTFHVPSEADLLDARSQRDKLILEIHQSLQAQRIPTESTWQSLENAIEQSDSISDRLRRESDRVAHLVELSADLNENETKQHEIANRLAKLDIRSTELATKWDADWPELIAAPKSMRDLQTWLGKRKITLQLIDDVAQRDSLAAKLAAKISSHRQSLVAALKGPQEEKSPSTNSQSAEGPAPTRKQLSFAWESDKTEDDLPSSEERSESTEKLTLRELLELAESRLEQNEKRQTELRDTAQSIGSIERQQKSCLTNLSQLKSDLDSWRIDWQAQLNYLKLPLNETTEQTMRLVEISIEHASLTQQLEQLSERIDGIDQDGLRFTNRAQSLFQRVAPDLQSAELEVAVKSIQTRLSNAQRDQTKLEDLTKQQQHSQSKLETSIAGKSRASQLLQSLREECFPHSPGHTESTSEQFQQTVSDLTQLEAQANQKKVLEEQVSRLNERLREFAKDEPLQEFIHEVESFNATDSAAQAQTLKSECERLEQERDQLNKQIGSAENRLSLMDGVSKAAEAEELQAMLFTRIRSDVEHYARTRLASVILHSAIERYRERSRGPVLQAASELFRELTLGSFDGLRVEEDDSGKLVLVGVRRDQRTRVTVSGMSEGTCDQLYLAVRLASLKLEAAPRNHLPFIVDDILIQFDDARSAAALKIFSLLGKQRQIIFFTHHERLIEIARQDPTIGVSTHTLSS